MLLDEDHFRSVWQTIELGDVLLLSQLHATVLVLWSQCRAPPPLGVFPFLFDLLLQFLWASTRNFVWILIHLRVSPFLLSAWRPRDQTRYLSRSPLWTLVHLRVSPFLLIGFLVLVGFVGYLCCFQSCQNPNRTSNYLCKKFSVVVEVTRIPSGIWFLQVSSQLLSRYNRVGLYRKGWLRSILFGGTSILFVEQAENWPSTPCPGAFSTHFCLSDARSGLVKSSSCGSLWSFFMGFTAEKNTVCLSLLEVCPPAVNPEFVMECKLTGHPTWKVYSKKLFGINIVLKCGINGIASWMILKSSEIKNFLSWWISTTLKSFLVSFAFCHLNFPHIVRLILRVLIICSEDHLSLSRIRSLHLLLEVIDHAEEGCLVFLPLGTIIGLSSWFNINPYSFTNRYSYGRWGSRGRSSWFCFSLGSACKRKYFRLRFRGLLLVVVVLLVDQICDQLV